MENSSYTEEDLIRTKTSSFKDSNGVAMGFEGDQFLYLIGGFLVSIVVLMLCLISQMHVFKSAIISILPTVFMWLYLKIFLAGKPPHYQADLFQDLLHGYVYERNLGHKENPYYKSLVLEAVRQDIENTINKKEKEYNENS